MVNGGVDGGSTRRRKGLIKKPKGWNHTAGNKIRNWLAAVNGWNYKPFLEYLRVRLNICTIRDGTTSGDLPVGEPQFVI
jgi:hypothetical protein